MSWSFIAWDDNAQFFANLRPRLEQRGWKVDDHVDINKCFDTFSRDPSAWDGAILDVRDDTDPEYPLPKAGIRLARELRVKRPGLPITFLSSLDVGFIYEAMSDLPPGPILVRPKAYPTQMLMFDLNSFMESCPRYDRVFLIYGHNRRSGNIKETIFNAIEAGGGIVGPGVQCITLDPDSVMQSITEELQRAIAQCGVAVAICTPDDKVGDTWYQPRQNVLLEMGMMLGASDGFRRLIVLQRWGDSAETQARLPSDLGGALTIQFFENHDDSIEKVLSALRKKGVIKRDGSAN